MSRFMVFGGVLSLLVFSGLLGWLKAGTQSYTINASQAEWQAPPKVDDGQGGRTKLRQSLLSSPYFQSREARQNELNERPDEVDSAIAAAEKKYGPFPHIISISRIDGKDTAQLRQEDNAIISVHAGDTLPSGWVITRIFPDHLEADAGPERFSFAVFEHMSNQEQDSVEK